MKQFDDTRWRQAQKTNENDFYVLSLQLPSNLTYFFLREFNYVYRKIRL